MQTTTEAQPVEAAAQQPPYRDIMKAALAQFAAPATAENFQSRAALFVAAISGAVGYHDKAMGAAIYAVVDFPQPAAAGAA